MFRYILGFLVVAYHLDKYLTQLEGQRAYRRSDWYQRGLR